MTVKKAEFIISAVDPAQYPNNGFPEIALAGRSNVGKSSLINSLVNRKSIARVGNTPGKTRIINFYNINDEIMLVDLPGYGFAKVSKEEMKSWGRLANTYLTTRSEIRVILLLVDIRHIPSEDDILMMKFIRESGRKAVIIATKADKMNRSEYKKQIDIIKTYLCIEESVPVIPFSSLKRMGIEEVWSTIENMLG